MDTHYEPSLLRAMQLTGGYINTICENSTLLASIEVPSESRISIKTLGRYVAAMRARPSISKDEERHEKELPSRLVSQLTRLSVCLAGAMSKKSTDAEVMRRVKQTALDTAKGKTVEYVIHLHRKGEEGVDPASMAVWLQEEEARVRHYLRFLTKIYVAEMFKPAPKFKGQNPKQRWRLTPRMFSVYQEVLSDA
jgi:hypothetical protein